MAILTDLADVKQALLDSHRIAVLGASTKPHRAGFYVPEYMQTQGYEVYPVNPLQVGKAIWGEPVVGRLSQVPTWCDTVNIYRRSEFLPGHTDEILSLDPLPRLVFFQLLVFDPASAARLSAAGIDVIQNRCMYADHQRLGLPPRSTDG